MRKGTIHIVQRMAPGGIELLVRDLASQLPGDNRIFSLDGTRKQLINAWPALEPHAKQIRGFSKKPGINMSLLLELRSTFKQLKPHAVVTHHVGPLIYAGLAARLANVPIIAHVEHDVWHYGHPRRRMLTKAVCSVVRPRIVGVSMTAADTLADITGSKDVRVITNGVDTKRFTPEDREEVRKRWDIPVNAPVIGAVGRLEMVKGHDVLLEAMIGLPDNIICVIAGAGSQMVPLQEKAKALGIADQVKFLGNVPDTSSIYSAFDVLCLPSRAEGLPLTILEAQSCGVPVVATDVGSVRDAVCPDIGRVVPAEEPEEMAVSLLEMLRQTEIPSPRSFVSENFSWNSTLASYSQLVRA
ncbi:MAG: glycosyltransferase [Hyphomicrobiales bacterium]